MVKKLSLALAILLLLFGGGAVLLYLNASTLLEGAKPQLQAILRQQLGADLDFQKVDLTVRPLPQLTVRDLKFSKEGSKGESYAVEIAETEIALAVAPLLAKKLQLTKMKLIAPRIRVDLRTEKSSRSNPLPAGANSATSTVTTDGGSPSKAAIVLLADTIKITDGELELLQDERTVKVSGLKASLAVKELNLGIIDGTALLIETPILEGVLNSYQSKSGTPIALKNEPFQIGAQAIELLARPGGRALTIGQIKGELLGVELRNGSLSPQEGGILQLDLAIPQLEESLQPAKAFLPALTELQLAGAAAFNGKIELETGLIVGQLTSRNLQGQYAGQKFRSGTASTNLQLSSQNQAIKNLTLSAELLTEDAQGNIELAGNLKLPSKEQPLSGGIKISSKRLPIAAIQPLLKRFAPDLNLTGDLAPNLNLTLNPNGPELVGLLGVSDGGLEKDGLKLSPINAVVQLNNNGKQTRAEIEQGTFELGEMRRKISISGWLTHPQLDSRVKVNADELPLEQLLPMLAKLQGSNQGSNNAAELNWSGRIAPKLEIRLTAGQLSGTTGSINLSQVMGEFGQTRVAALSGNIALDEQQFSSSDLRGDINDEPLRLSFTANRRDSKITLQQSRLEGLAGFTTLSGSYQLNSKELNANLDSSEISLERALRALVPSVSQQITGTVRKLSAGISGNLDRSLAQTLTGEGALQIADAKIKGVNLVREALNKLSENPLLAALVPRDLPQRFSQYLEKDDTELKLIAADLIARSGTTATDNLELVGEFFRISAQGTLDPTAKVNLRATLTFDREFSALLLSSVKEVKPLLNKRGELPIPLNLTGNLPNISVRPDMEELLRSRLEGELKLRATETLEGILGVPRSRQESRQESRQDTRQDQYREQNNRRELDPQPPADTNSGGPRVYDQGAGGESTPPDAYNTNSFDTGSYDRDPNRRPEQAYPERARSRSPGQLTPRELLEKVLR